MFAHKLAFMLSCSFLTISLSVFADTCPTNFSCCPNLSQTQTVDLQQWQLTGQPLTNNTQSKAWWVGVPKSYASQVEGYITCYYNLDGSNPFTLQSIFPVNQPTLGKNPAEENTWQNSTLPDTLSCKSTSVSDCPFVFGKQKI